MALTRLAALVLLGMMWAQVCFVPYTKVEESFSLQAVHDILTHGVMRRDQYDHLSFPGAVPRSFIGALLLSVASLPAALCATSAGVQLGVRLVLGTCAWAAMVHMACLLCPKASRVRALFYVLCAIQYHLTFWTSRTTPNGLAFPLATVALTHVVHGRHAYKGLALLAATAMMLRLELVCLAVPAYLWTWWHHQRRFVYVFMTGAVTCAGSIALSVLVDSYFWRKRFLWPEGHAVIFNVIEGRSAEWGVSPPWTYVVRDLPRILFAAFPLALLGCTRRSSFRSPLVLLICTHVGLMSFLAHKEWRFLVYIVPLCNMLAAQGASMLIRTYLGRWLMLGLVGTSAALWILGTHVSIYNYPGGEALRILHTQMQEAQVVHIDTLAAMTGVSLFQSIHLARPAHSLVPSQAPVWVYDKREHVLDDCTWTLAISERACHAPYALVGEPISGYDGLRLRRTYVQDLLHAARGGTWPTISELFPLEIRFTPRLWICRRTEPC